MQNKFEETCFKYAGLSEKIVVILIKDKIS